MALTSCISSTTLLSLEQALELIYFMNLVYHRNIFFFLNFRECIIAFCASTNPPQSAEFMETKKVGLS